MVSALTAACAAPAYSLRFAVALPLVRLWAVGCRCGGGASSFGIVVIRGLGRSICSLACYRPVGLVICIYSVI